MSKETIEWLNQQCLIGFTEKRGHAWHYRASAQGAEPNHYPGPIPVEDVHRRLFAWSAIECPVSIVLPDGTSQIVPDRKAIVADDTHTVLGLFKDGYAPHQYGEWLVQNVATILDDDLGIGSALLLRNRGVAVVQVELPENFSTKSGVEYRPNLLAVTSFDGTVATTYKRTVTVAVCDNTTERGLREQGQQWKVKHSRNSTLKLGAAREALALILSAGDDFAAEIDHLCDTAVSEWAWGQVLDALVPVPEDSKLGRTRAFDKRDALASLWTSDERVAPWRGTAWGVAQAFNTYNQHLGVIRGAHRVERAFDNAITGKVGASDDHVLDVVSDVLGTPVLAR